MEEIEHVFTRDIGKLFSAKPDESKEFTSYLNFIREHHSRLAAANKLAPNATASKFVN